MFEDPHMIYEIAKMRHKELLAEAEHIRKVKSPPNVAGRKNRRFNKMVLPFADLLIAIGVGLNRRFGPISEGGEDPDNDDVLP